MSLFYDFFEYHQKTKHSYHSVRNFPNRLDWDNQPSAFKTYPKQFKRIALGEEYPNYDFLYYIAGVSAKKTYPGVEYYLRVNPSAGALYPNEIYFQCRNQEGFEDGIYHFEIKTSSVTLLKKLEEGEGIEANLGFDFSCDGFMFFISSIYYRSSWKYKKRAFRYCLLDAGHILGSIEASAYLFEKDFEIIYDFDKKYLNKLFSFDEKEFFTSIVVCGKNNKKNLNPINLDLVTVDGLRYENDNGKELFEKEEIIEKAYENSLKINNKIVQLEKAKFIYNRDLFKEVIFKRRSVRGFNKASISKAQLESILNMLNQAISSDCDEEIDIYYVVNRVEGLPLGLYKDGVCIKKGDYSSKAGYLCLEQDLGSSSAVTFFLASKARNYQALYQKAGIIGHRLYLSSNYLQVQCSGIGAYYDDEVCEFIDDYSMVLYALAIGN